MAVPCVPDVPQVFKFFEKIFGKRDMGHMKNHIMAVPHVPKSSKFLNFFFFTWKNLLSETLKKKKKLSGSLCGIRAGATRIFRNNLVCKHVNDYNNWNTSYSLKLSYSIFILEWFPVEWRNQFLKLYNIDQECLFLQVSKLWKSAVTKEACSKWFFIYTHLFLDILQ